jgi:hypothetical protein
MKQSHIWHRFWPFAYLAPPFFGRVAFNRWHIMRQLI